MRTFELLPHTADLRLKVFGDSLEELFHAAVEGMAAIIKKDACGVGKMTEIRRVSLSSADRTALLVDFLSEVLTTSQTDKVVFCDVNFEKLTETELTAEIKGAKVDEPAPPQTRPLSEWRSADLVSPKADFVQPTADKFGAGFDEDIKAVTYHEANIVQNENGQWETIIIFDI